MIKSWTHDNCIELSLFAENDNGDLPENWQPFASADERERAAKMASPERAYTFLRSRALLRHELAKLLNRKPAEIEIGLTAAGKPIAAGAGVPAFSISHSKNLILIAIMKGGTALGVDLQYIDPNADIDKIAERFFIDEDRAKLSKAKPADKRTAAFQAWCLREARYKLGKEARATKEHAALLENDFAYAVCYAQ